MRLREEYSNEREAMPQSTSDERMRGWVVDYSEARAKAIARLGDRYLLAKPIKRRHVPSTLSAARGKLRTSVCASEP